MRSKNSVRKQHSANYWKMATVQFCNSSPITQHKSISINHLVPSKISLVNTKINVSLEAYVLKFCGIFYYFCFESLETDNKAYSLLS